MNASRSSVIGLALLIGVLAAGRSASWEPGVPAAAEKVRGTSVTLPGLFGPEDAAKPGPGSKRFKGTGHALLVGCTEYDNLPDKYKLEGPANDVLLMRDLLLTRGFQADNIVILSEAAGKKRRPIKANIKAEFERLARVAKAGDLVVIHLAGHGSQQPVPDPDDPDNYEPDGLDETFLPADVGGKWDDGAKTVPNAITDNEIAAWLKAIRKKKAAVVLIADACHSSTLARDPDERDRRVEPTALVPAAVLQKAEQEAAKRAVKGRGKLTPLTPFKLPDDVPDLVALYAAQTTEPTVERRLPLGSRDAKPYGLFTFMLVAAVTSAASPMTYQEVCDAVRNHYTGMGRSFPKPAVEGKDRDHEFLGTGDFKGVPPRRRPVFLLKRDEDGLKVNAGAIHGLTVGSVLAVYPPAGQPNADKPLGHGRITDLEGLQASVTPCAFNKMPAPAKLPSRGRCQPVYIDLGSQRLRVAAAASGPGAPKRSKLFDQLQATLAEVSRERGSVLELVKEPRTADWMAVAEGEKVVLIPAPEWRRARSGKSARAYGPAAIDARLGDWIKDNLGRIARGQAMLRLASASAGLGAFGEGSPVVTVEVLRYADKVPTTRGEVVREGPAGMSLQAGEYAAFRISNRGRETVDVTLLFIDNDYGITAIFPQPGTVSDNRLLPKQTLLTKRGKVTGTTVGLEHIVAIVVKAGNGQQADFSYLEQPSLSRARELSKKGNPAPGSPLGQLFQNSLYGTGIMRGFSRDSGEAAAPFSMRLLSWSTLPPKAKKPVSP